MASSSTADAFKLAQQLHVAALQAALSDAKDAALRVQHADLAALSFAVPLPGKRPEARAAFAAANRPAYERYWRSNPKVQAQFSSDRDAFLAFMDATLVEG